MGIYAEADYNLPLRRLQSRLQHIYHGQPYARVDLNPMPESTLSPCQGLRIWPQLARAKVSQELPFQSLENIRILACAQSREE
jgi:hypothetical protein